jgi:DNA-binding LacI/PurR family transcriptional regulator
MTDSLPGNTPTLRDLAKALGLNISTVSRGLKNSPLVAQATRDRIQAKAEEMGYRPDPALARLSLRRWDGREAARAANLAMIASRNDPGVARNTFIPQAQATAERLGYALDVLFLEDYKRPQALDRLLRSRGVDGLLLGMLLGAKALPELDWNRYAVLVYGDPPFDLPFNQVRANTYLSARTAFDRLWKAGYRRIGLVQPEVKLENDRRLLSGWENGARFHGIKLAEVPEPCTLILGAPLGWPAAISEWLREQRPDAAIVASPGIELFLVKAAGELADPGRRPFGLISTLPGTSGEWPRVSIPVEHLAQSALHQLSAALMHGERGIPVLKQTLLVDPVWHDGPTLVDS